MKRHIAVVPLMLIRKLTIAIAVVLLFNCIIKVDALGRDSYPISTNANDIGSPWSIVPSPSIGTNTNILTSVAAFSASNVWAVGTYFISGPIGQTLIEHYLPVNIPNISWAGYATSGSPYPNPSQPTKVLYSDIKGSWKVPPASCPIDQPSSSVAFWVGLGGTQGELEQIGILIQCDGSTGTISYDAVYEIIINGSGTVVFLKDKNPGDLVNANDKIISEVKYLGKGQYKLSITDNGPSNKWSFLSPALSGSSVDAAHDAADWITEAPTINGSVQPLTQFGTVYFSNCKADGESISSGPTINQFVMTVGGNPGGPNKAVPSPLNSNSTAFSVKWYNSGP